MFNSPRFTARHTGPGSHAVTLFTRLGGLALPTLGLCLAATVLSGLVGCQSSKDKHAYVSTIYRPTTITIKDTVTDEFIWKMDIPVEHTLTLDFNRKGEMEWASVNADMPATHMKWSLKDRWSDSKVDHGTFEMPAPHGTMVLLSLRPAPEKPVAISGSFSPEVLGGSEEDPAPAGRTETVEEGAESSVPADADSPALLYEPALADAPAAEVEAEAVETPETPDTPDTPEMTEAVEAVEVTPEPAPAPASEESDPLLDALDLDK